MMKRSIIAFICSAALGLASMGALGALLYYAASPVLAPFYGKLADWESDWVWPAMIAAGIGWSVSFLVSGLLNLKLEALGVRLTWRRAIYATVLWLGAVGTWIVVLAGWQT